MTSTVQTRRGVYPSANGWSWFDPGTQTQGPDFPSRDKARESFKQFQSERATVVEAAADAAPVETAKSAAPAKRKKDGKAKAKKSDKRQWTAGASAKAWSIFNKQPTAKRKDVLALCVKAGINLNTAKTQYQHWLHRKESSK